MEAPIDIWSVVFLLFCFVAVTIVFPVEIWLILAQKHYETQQLKLNEWTMVLIQHKHSVIVYFHLNQSIMLLDVLLHRF